MFHLTYPQLMIPRKTPIGKGYTVSTALIHNNAYTLNDITFVNPHATKNLSRGFVFDHVKLQSISLPTGKAEIGETPFMCLVRELKEEVGIDVLSAGYCGSSNFTIPETNIVARVDLFVVYSYMGTVTNMEPEKHHNPRWIDLDELTQTDATARNMKMFTEFQRHRKGDYDRLPMFYNPIIKKY